MELGSKQIWLEMRRIDIPTLTWFFIWISYKDKTWTRLGPDLNQTWVKLFASYFEPGNIWLILWIMKENDVVISTILISISNSFFSVLVLHFKKVFLLSRSIHKSEKGQMWGQEARSGSDFLRNGFSTSKWINQVWSCQFTYRFSSQTHIVRLTVRHCVLVRL